MALPESVRYDRKLTLPGLIFARCKPSTQLRMHAQDIQKVCGHLRSLMMRWGASVAADVQTRLGHGRH